MHAAKSATASLCPIDHEQRRSWTVIRQLLAESTLLSLIGAGFELVLAWLSSRFLVNTISKCTNADRVRSHAELALPWVHQRRRDSRPVFCSVLRPRFRLSLGRTIAGLQGRCAQPLTEAASFFAGKCTGSSLAATAHRSGTLCPDFTESSRFLRCDGYESEKGGPIAFEEVTVGQQISMP
jgi:hypothetical protein